jgi:hypothetical protein
MSDSFLENLPGKERAWYERLKRRSPAEYEKFKREAQERREVREKTSEKASHFAEFNFAFESEPETRDAVKDKIKEGIKKNPDGVVEGKPDAKLKQALEKGNFDVSIDKSQAVPRITVKPSSAKEGSKQSAAEGNISEALPLKPTFQDKLILSLQMNSK